MVALSLICWLARVNVLESPAVRCRALHGLPPRSLHIREHRQSGQFLTDQRPQRRHQLGTLDPQLDIWPPQLRWEVLAFSPTS